MRSSVTLVAAAAAAAALTAATPYQCPPLGPVLPKAKNPSTHPAVQAAVSAFIAGLEAETATFTGSAVSIGVKSSVEEGPLVDFHFTPPERDPRGANAVDTHTVYRLASVTKIFPVLAALQNSDLIGWEDSVAKFIPELRDAPKGELDYVDWEDVTVEAAAVHIGGVAAEMMTDGAAYPGDWEAIGLPPVAEEDKPKCGGFLGLPACTREELLDALKTRRPPVYPAYQSPVYSNLGTALVGLVVEGATNKTLEDVLAESVLGPAGMGNTTYGKLPEDLSTLFIPANDTYYDFQLGVLDPSGGMYSTTADMLRFGDAILRNKLLSPAKTRRWLKPSSFTSAPGSFVGKPWEGIASDNLTADGRLVEVYTKGGDLITHHALLVVVPEYGITMSVLAAGIEVSGGLYSYYMFKMGDLLPPLIRALDEAARDEARDRIAGTYADEATNSSLTISLDGGWGLLLSDWRMRGFEVIPNLSRYSFLGVNVTELPADRERTARLYPTGLESEGGGNRTAWRALFDTFTAAQRDAVDDLLFYPNASCVSWLSMDRTTYDYKALDHFEFAYGEDGRVESVLPKPFALSLQRVE
ncbi:beta-lactamase [Colletotrichum higginsianum IMI 349063]|uniref:Beta-lactamase n=1 Tax=Colletotrichum higginsianum (strain IMI 349063) TaxID=759273 RepID=A0A1B7Y8T8_COLHI|nr:beta-lactamase [Colletotrichum higginsianum IMI 349063]OBR08424.1 beta-lactamase [Colletotrichum higginsianum IMI 349063]